MYTSPLVRYNAAFLTTLKFAELYSRFLSGPKKHVGHEELSGLAPDKQYLVQGQYSKKHGYQITKITQLGQEADMRIRIMEELLLYGLK